MIPFERSHTKILCRASYLRTYPMLNAFFYLVYVISVILILEQNLLKRTLLRTDLTVRLKEVSVSSEVIRHCHPSKRAISVAVGYALVNITIVYQSKVITVISPQNFGEKSGFSKGFSLGGKSLFKVLGEKGFW